MSTLRKGTFTDDSIVSFNYRSKTVTLLQYAEFLCRKTTYFCTCTFAMWNCCENALRTFERDVSILLSLWWTKTHYKVSLINTWINIFKTILILCLLKKTLSAMLQLVHRYIEFHSTCNLRISVIFMYLQYIVYLFLCLSISVKHLRKKGPMVRIWPVFIENCIMWILLQSRA